MLQINQHGDFSIYLLWSELDDLDKRDESVEMKTVTANELKQSAGRVMDEAQRNPVVVEKYGRPHAVILSHADYLDFERMKYAALKAGIAEGLDSGDAGIFDPDDLIAEIEGESPQTRS